MWNAPFLRVCWVFVCLFNCYRLFPCHGSAWGINLGSSQGFPEPVPFSGHVWWFSNFSCICSCLRIYSFLMSSPPKRKRQKAGDGGSRGSTDPLSPPELVLAYGEGACNMLCVCIIMSSYLYVCIFLSRGCNQWSEYRSLL